MALTKYPQGSIRELMSLSFPLMLSSLSFLSILFVDRIFLTNFSTEALTAAVHASTSGWVFVFSGIALVSISEVFVAQFYGAEELNQIGRPVWQMIWLALLSICLFLPIGYWGGIWLFGAGGEKILAREYFSWMLYFGPAFALTAALTGFFIGRGKTRLVTVLAVVANALNVFFDWILIFGVEGWIPSMGTKGAAIATSIGACIQALVLLWVFLRQSNRTIYGTGNCKIDRVMMWSCVRIGFPNALFYALEGIGWAYYYHMMDMQGMLYITVASIVQSLNVLFYFFGEGINKAATALTGFLIGSKAEAGIGNIIRSGVIMTLIFFGMILASVLIWHDEIIRVFLPHATEEQLSEWHYPLVLGLFSCSVYILFEGLRLLFTGVLTAVGDTLFLLIGGTLVTWLSFMVPVYLLLGVLNVTVELAIFTIVFFSICSALLYVIRWHMRPVPYLVLGQQFPLENKSSLDPC